MKDIKLDDIEMYDIRFPASVKRARKDVKATDFDPNYTSIYVIIKTSDKDHQGYGIALIENRKGLMEVIIKSMFNAFLKNRSTEEIYAKLGSIWKELSTKTSHWFDGKSFDYLRPAAVTAIMNALWDLWARIEGKPVWKLLSDMTPQDFITTIDFSKVMDVITPEETIEILSKKNRRQENILKEVKCYASATGIGYYDNLSNNNGPTYQRIRDLCRNFKKLKFLQFEVYADQVLEKSLLRYRVVLNMIGKYYDKPQLLRNKIVLNTNEIIWKCEELLNFLDKLHRQYGCRHKCCIELPTTSYNNKEQSRIRIKMDKKKYINIKTSSGEKCGSHLEFKKFITSDIPHIWQINIGKVGGLNEALIIYLMAHKKQKPVLLHGDGLGLSEMGQHVRIWDHMRLPQKNQGLKIFQGDYFELDSIVEFVNYQHGYFENPVHIQNGCYMPPTRPGFSTKLKDKCILRWCWPGGTRWKHLIKTKDLQKSNKKAELEDDKDNMEKSSE